MVSKRILIKSAVVGLTVTILDYFFHTNYANPETIFYYIFKFILASYLAYYVFEPSKIRSLFNVLKFKDRTIPFYLYFSAVFAFLHGLYYRAIEFYQGREMFSRVGNIDFFGLTFQASVLFEATLGWLIFHSLMFFLGIIIAEQLEKNKII